ncbi:MAG: hypothetical protein A2075_00175 [Geobacteraceae bacterium GWC2_58_44]|nr:MAG: hypothetical protein A2075_00175 [Geobacteraceae bacterium GWC2_58_44]HBG06524.1 hypothetical protein [Geobacter sp.]
MAHLIRKEYLHVELDGTEAEALALQRTLSGVCRNHLAPAIERALDRSAPEAGHLVIERVEIDAGVLQLERLESGLADSVEQALGKWLREHVPLTGSPPAPLQGSGPQRTAPGPVVGALRHRSARDAAMEALVHFLRHGTLPWWFRPPAGKTLEQMIVEVWQEAGKAELEAALAAHGILAALAEGPAGIRLIRQFSPSFTATVLAAVAPEHRTVVAATYPAAPQEEVRSTRALSNSPQAEHPEAREGLYVGHAGLVLLHPFLPRFFAALGIADEDRLLQPERALCLLYYLATGQPAAPEYELVLPKILCGIPLPEPVSADLALSGPEKEEAMALLEAVIAHWDALRSSSCDELRGAFLVRPGKVSLRDDGDWLLQVEAQTCDILLDQLRWGLSMVKLPWMKRMLWVEWG